MDSNSLKFKGLRISGRALDGVGTGGRSVTRLGGRFKMGACQTSKATIARCTGNGICSTSKTVSEATFSIGSKAIRADTLRQGLDSSRRIATRGQATCGRDITADDSTLVDLKEDTSGGGDCNANARSAGDTGLGRSLAGVSSVIGRRTGTAKVSMDSSCEDVASTCCNISNFVRASKKLRILNGKKETKAGNSTKFGGSRG